MPQRVVGLNVLVNGAYESSETTVETSGAGVLGVMTILGTRRDGLASIYITDSTGETAFAHVRMTPQPTRLAPEPSKFPVPSAGQSHARACLLDHAAELQRILQDALGESVCVDVPDGALAFAEAIWRAA
jgi:hypothetical protein